MPDVLCMKIFPCAVVPIIVPLPDKGTFPFKIILRRSEALGDCEGDQSVYHASTVC